MSKLTYLARRSIVILREEGLATLLFRMYRFIYNILFDIVLFIPSLPPIGGLGLKDKYIHEEVAPEPSDTILEAGVYHGRDTAMFAKEASNVIAFEASPRNYAVAKNNLRRFDNIHLENKGLWDERGELELQYGTKAGDDGFLEPDDGSTGQKEVVPVDRIDTVMDELDIEEVNFLKVEAEGAEPEVIAGMGDICIEKVAVNVGEERDGESTEEEVSQQLRAEGYEIVGKKRYILFASKRC